MNTPHPIGWDSKTHYMSIGGQCGQSCPCCRSAAGDTLGACPICNQIKEKAAADKQERSGWGREISDGYDESKDTRGPPPNDNNAYFYDWTVDPTTKLPIGWTKYPVSFSKFRVTLF